MQPIRNERGSVLVFVTLMMVLLFIMVGMGLDTGHLAYIRSQGQPAVDAAALAAVTALPTNSLAEVNKRAAQLNFNSGSNAGGNNYLNSPNNLIGGNNVTLISYDDATGDMTAAASIGEANGVRVALETANPYGGSANTPMKAPLFLTPLLNLFGQKSSGTQNVGVSAVAVLRAIPSMPIAIAGCANYDPTTKKCDNDCRPPNAGCDADAAGNPIGNGTWASPYRNCKLLQVSSANNGNGNTVDVPKYQDSGWTTFSTPSANAPSIKALVRNNSTCANIPPVEIGTCIYLNNGQITPVLTEFNDVYGNNPDSIHNIPGGLSQTNPPYANDWGIIPVVRKDISNFNGCEPVRSFARFGIRDVVKSGNDKWLVGDLVCNARLRDIGPTGCYTTQLVRDTKSGM